MRTRRLLATVACAGLVAGGAVATGSTPAGAGQGTGNPVVSVSTNRLPASGRTTLTVKGTDYLVPPHAAGTNVFGGVYVFFGWVSNPGRFGPSIRSSTDNNGTFGVTYAYPGDGGDPSTRTDPEGKMRLVSFTAGGESGSATSFHMDDNGNWTTTLNVYGSTFTTTDPATGQTRSFDCQKVQCGVLTIGAHGKASSTNERFTPVTFTGTSPGTGSSGSGGSSGGSGTGTGSGSTGSGATGTAGGSVGASGSNGGTGASGTGQGVTGSAGGGTPGSGGSTSGGASAATTAPKSATTVAPTTTEVVGTSIVEEGDAAADESAAGTRSETAADGVAVSSTRSTGGSPVPIVLGGVAVLAVAIGGGLFWRRRHKGPEPTP